MLFAAARGQVILRKHFADYADRGPGGECDQKLNMIKCCCRISKSARDKVLPTAHFSLLQDTLLCITAVTSYLSRRDDGRGASPRIPIYIVLSTTSHRHL